MSAQGPKGIDRVIKATVYSAQGIRYAFTSEAAFRQELALAVILFPLGLWLGETGVEKALLCGVLLIVLIVELLNTGIEVVVDRFGGEHHKLSGQAKDVGSAAVFFSLLNVLVIWCLVILY